MTYETYRFIFVIALILSIVFLVTAVILFFRLHIPRVIGDLSGATARKAIRSIREQNRKTGDKAYRSSMVNLQRGKLTNKITASGRLEEAPLSENGMGMPTEKIRTEKTAVGNETTVLQNPQNETTVLNMPQAQETTVLSQEQAKLGQFAIIYEITFIHTNEIIVS